MTKEEIITRLIKSDAITLSEAMILMQETVYQNTNPWWWGWQVYPPSPIVNPLTPYYFTTDIANDRTI